MKKYLLLFAVIIPLCVSAQKGSQWRGDNRDGVYNETGLLKEWPAEGPQLLWKYEGLGDGHTSVSIANDKVYVTGMTDSIGNLYVFNTKGDLLTKKPYGKEWNINFNGSRSTVCANDGRLYIMSGRGDLYCWDEEKLTPIWQKGLFTDFDGINLKFGMTESPLIVNDLIYATPGGKKNNFIALNKKSGELVWSASAEQDTTAYCSPQYIGDQAIPIVCTMTMNGLVAFHAQTGEMLWAEKQRNKNGISPNTPIYSNGMLFSTTGGGSGSIMLKLTDNGRGVEKSWSQELDNKMGGAVKIGSYVYGSGEKNRYWYCLDWNTGEIKYKDNSVGIGVVIAADNMLYCYSDKGEVALVNASPEKFELKGKFKVTLGTNQHWAHPVIHNGVLYIRHGDALMAYCIK